VPHTLDLIVQPRLAPRHSLATDRFLRAETLSGSAGSLRVRVSRIRRAVVAIAA